MLGGWRRHAGVDRRTGGRPGRNAGHRPGGTRQRFRADAGVAHAAAAAVEVLLSGAPRTVDVLEVTIPGDEPACSAYGGVDSRAGEIVNTVRWIPLGAVSLFRGAGGDDLPARRLQVAVDGDGSGGRRGIGGRRELGVLRQRHEDRPQRRRQRRAARRGDHRSGVAAQADAVPAKVYQGATWTCPACTCGAAGG